MSDTDSTERRAGERRVGDRRGLLDRRAGPGRRIWIRRELSVDAGEADHDVPREEERRAETPRRSAEPRRTEERRKGDRRL